MAAGLLRRAAVHFSRPISASHAEAMLRARLALAELVAGGGGEARGLFKGVAEAAGACAEAAGKRGVRKEVAVSMQEVEKAARARVA